MFRTVTATSPAHFEQARQLFEEYAGTLGVNLCFQNFAEEIKTLPAMYGPPTGTLLLVYDDLNDLNPVACCGVRKAGEHTAELKRMYVQPSHRGKHLSPQLLHLAQDAARSLGYQTLVLDTLPTMVAAQKLYLSEGFTLSTPYYKTPVDGTLFMEKAL